MRASEVKPKLDWFIFTRLGEENYSKVTDDQYEEIADTYEKEYPGNNFDELYDIDIKTQYIAIGKFIANKKKWIKGKGLDYKMRIEVGDSSSRDEYLLASYFNKEILSNLNNSGIKAISGTPFFAQEKDNGNIAKATGMERRVKWNNISKKGILQHDITLSILVIPSKNEEKDYDGVKDDNKDSLSEYLQKHIQAFFLSTNFGTRQSKGFGCYTVTAIESNGTSVHLKNDEQILKMLFKFVYRKKTNGKLNSILTTINNDYRLIKSGQNNPYEKGKMMLYANEQDNGWDKKYIKKAINNLPSNRYALKDEHPQDHYGDHDDYKYYRAMLGLAEQFEFLITNPPRLKSKMIVKIDNPDIKRYQSPILFKVIGQNIYLVGNDVSKKMLDKVFSFSVSVQNDDSFGNKTLGNMKTPSEFSLRKFITFVMADESFDSYTQL